MRLLLDNGGSARERCAAVRFIRGTALSAAEKSYVINLLLRDERREVRFAAAMEAGFVGDGTTIDLLWEIIHSDQNDQNTRTVALCSLGDLIGPALVPTLLAFLKSADDVRRSDAF